MSKTKQQVVVRRKNPAPQQVPIEAEEVLVTPEQAMEWLTERNKHNRELRPAVVKRYVHDINRGHWERTGDTIKFDANGNLLDGQHRLQAIFDTGKPQHCLIARNVPTSAFMHIDTGATRQGGDVLSIAGYDNAKLLSAAARFASQLEKIGRSEMSYTALGKVRLPNDELLAWVGANPEIVGTLSMVTTRAARAVMSPPSLFRALSWYLSQVDEKDATVFFESLASGIGLVGGDPVLVLRNTLVAEKAKAVRSDTRPYWYYAAVTVKAWNAFRADKSIKQLRFASGGSNREPWPTPV